MRYKLIALMGESGSGKDTVLREILKQYPNKFHKVINTTTRPKREGEIDGVTYNFITYEQFVEKMLSYEFFESSVFNDYWCYGSEYSSLSLDKINIGIFNPVALETLLNEEAENLFEVYVFYIKTSPKERLLRQLNRENNPNVNEIVRRFSADEEDFSFLNFSYIELENEKAEDLVSIIKMIGEFAVRPAGQEKLKDN